MRKKKYMHGLNLNGLPVAGITLQAEMRSVVDREHPELSINGTPFKASDEWFSNFCKRNRLSRRKITTSGRPFPTNSVEILAEWVKDINDCIDEFEFNPIEIVNKILLHLCKIYKYFQNNLLILANILSSMSQSIVDSKKLTARNTYEINFFFLFEFIKYSKCLPFLKNKTKINLFIRVRLMISNIYSAFHNIHTHTHTYTRT
jgi:hypothetical protein